MKIKPADLAPNEFAFCFETNDAVHPQALGTFLRELERIAHLQRHFGPEAEVRLVEIGTGSVWGKIAIATATLAGVGSFALALEQRLNSPTDPLAQAVAAMSLDSSVVSATIVTRDKVITIHTVDMAAVPVVALKRVNGGQMPGPGPSGERYYPVNDLPLPPPATSAKRSSVFGQPNVQRGDDMIELPLHGRINQGETPRKPARRNNQLKFGEDPLTFGSAPLTFGPSDRPALPAPMSARGGLKFGGSGDLRATRYYVGRLEPAGPLESHPHFEMATGAVYWVERSDRVEEDDLAYGMPVVVRAEIDDESNIMLVFEVIILSEA